MFEAILTPFCFVAGLVFGSFANVCILRVPERKSIVWPGSTCPKCQKPIKWYDNIPVLSWLFLRAKCRQCKQPISMQYPLVELVMGLFFALAAHKFGYSFKLLESCILIFGLVCLTAIDLKHLLLPDVFTLPGIALGLLLALASPDRSFLDALFGVLLGGGFFYAIAYIYAVLRKREGLGGGDIKLMGTLGAFLGWQCIPYIILVSSLVGSVLGVLILTVRRKGMSTEIPYGPYIAVAALSFLFEWPAFLANLYSMYRTFFGF